MDELEAIKRRKIEELQRQSLQQNMQEQAQIQQQVDQLEAVVKQIFTKDALARYGNVKTAHPEKAIQLLIVIGQLLQSGKVQQITDDQLKEILKQMASNTNIKIQRR
ncbi:MAG TPA: DNA-binding protein [Candidatus Nanoarchaeia archaeon]|nr:DNA-binding protein [Candidatus Nanoarchaeia archaeon]